MIPGKSYLSYFIVGLFMAGCSPTTQPTSTSSRYEEDLSQHRPQVNSSTPEIVELEVSNSEPVPFVEPTQHLKSEIDSVIRIKSSRNLETGYLKGFTIQIYSGRSREEANNAKYAVYDLLEDEEPQVFYDQPRFRVKVGQYYSRLEAEKSLNLLKTKFRQALILPERIPLE